jgi:hypothetical protein
MIQIKNINTIGSSAYYNNGYRGHRHPRATQNRRNEH